MKALLIMVCVAFAYPGVAYDLTDSPLRSEVLELLQSNGGIRSRIFAMPAEKKRAMLEYVRLQQSRDVAKDFPPRSQRVGDCVKTPANRLGEKARSTELTATRFFFAGNGWAAGTFRVFSRGLGVFRLVSASFPKWGFGNAHFGLATLLCGEAR